MASFLTRTRATLSVYALALALAGCNAQRADELSANVSAGSPVETPNAPAPAIAAGDAQPAAEKIELAANGVPLPPIRPDFAKLAKEQQQQTNVAANPPAAQQPAGTAAVQPEGVTAVARSTTEIPAQQRPTGIFAIFAGAPADPAAATQVPAASQVAAAAPATASDASPANRASIGAYERRVSGEPRDDEPAPASPRIIPGATIESGGVIRQLPSNASPVLVSPSPRIAASFGSIGGRRWRAAYDNVVVDCFPADLRRALDVIGEHFNSEVLVTSGARGNGRRRSMHRSCRAADIRVIGVSPGTVARYASTVPGINGVGTYRRVAVTHIDTRENRMAWRY